MNRNHRPIAVIALTAAVGVAHAGEPLAWRAPTQNCDRSELTNLAHYDLYYGSSSRRAVGLPVDASCGGPGPDSPHPYGKEPIRVRDSQDGTCVVSIDDAQPGDRYFVALVAVTSSGERSAFSNEAELELDATKRIELKNCARL